MFIGKYNKPACVTYFGTLSSLIGIYLAMTDHIKSAIICLVISGVADMFDGKVARKEKNRSESDKNYGIEIDSLSDTVCFVVFPIIILFKMGLTKWYNALIFALYGLAGIIRLAYFNINATADTPVKNYTGLPVTTAAAIFPALFLVSLLISKEHFLVVATIVNALVGILFISKIKIAKPKGNALYVFLAAAIIFIFYMLKLIFL